MYVFFYCQQYVFIKSLGTININVIWLPRAGKWLYRVKFGIPSTSLATKGDSITFSTPTIEGTVLRRNKPDGSGKHPWKAEVTEGEKDVPASVVTDWYKSVYEPAYATTLPETLPTENEEV